MVFIDLQIAATSYLQADARVAAYLLQHVVIEADPGIDAHRLGGVQVHAGRDVGLTRLAGCRRTA